MKRIKRILVTTAMCIFVMLSANGQKSVDNNPSNCPKKQDLPVKWNGNPAGSSWVNGSGTKDRPYLIEKPEHLAFMANLIKNGEGAGTDNVVFKGVYFKLMTNIDLNGVEWIPIGYRIKDSYHYFFGGHFDGNGYTISGLFVSSKDEWLGLFGGIKDGSITCLTVSGKIERKDPPVPAPIPEIPSPPAPTHLDPWIGGIVGYAENTIIKNCYSECNIYVENTNPTYLGGIAGACIGTGGIYMCANSGNIIASAAGEKIFLGGIAGYTNTNITASYNTGNIGILDYLSNICCRGGIAGYSAGSIIDCYNIGNIVGNCDAQRFSGGIVAMASNNAIENCYNAGNISETGGGAIIGKRENIVNVSNCYYLDASGGNNFLGGTSKKENFMKTINMVELLGYAFKQDNLPYFNQGYPILFNNALANEITEYTSSNKITVYPNPAATELHIILPIQETTNYFVYNSVGQMIMQGKIEESSVINIQSLGKGMYYILIAGEIVKFAKI